MNIDNSANKVVSEVINVLESVSLIEILAISLISIFENFKMIIFDHPLSRQFFEKPLVLPKQY